MQDGAGRDGTGRGQGGSKKYKPIPALPHGVGLKSRPITFAGREKPTQGKAGRDGAKLPSLC